MEVLNSHHLGEDWPHGSVYIGRKSTLSEKLLADHGDIVDGTALGNPCLPSKFKNPADCLEAYRIHLWKAILVGDDQVMRALVAIRGLQDPKLVCSCAPGPCHGDVIAEDWTYIVDAIDEWEAAWP